MDRVDVTRAGLRLARLLVIAGCMVGGTVPWGALADDPPVRAGAVFDVNSVADLNDDTPGDGICDNRLVRGCTLRAAVTEANALPGDDTISLPAGTYVLGSSGPVEDLNASGDLDITSTISITGAGRDATIVDGNATSTVFDVQPGATAQLNGLTIRNGNGAGYAGGARNRGTLAINDSLVANNRATDNGGGMSNNIASTLTLNNSEITGNTSGGNGGGIYNRGTLSIVQTIVALNTALDTGGGIGNNSGTVELVRSSINYNRAANEGGGIWNDSTLTLTQSFVTGNETTANPSYGGGLFNRGSTRVANSAVSENRTQRGGGNIYSSGELVVLGSEISRGLAGAGGGVSNAGQATLNNVTISGNVAANGGGWYNNVPGPQVVGMNGVTIAGNTGASAGGSIYNFVGSIQLRNTIVANSTAGENCVGVIASAGNNLDSAASCGFSTGGDRSGVDPRLGEPAANGNSNPGNTHALLPGSPAIDAGSVVDWLDYDQRGVWRPRDGNNDGSAVSDIGAYEVEPALASPVPSEPPASPAPSAPPPPTSPGKHFLPFVVKLWR